MSVEPFVAPTTKDATNATQIYEVDRLRGMKDVCHMCGAIVMSGRGP